MRGDEAFFFWDARGQPEFRASCALARPFSFPRPESAGPSLVPIRRFSRTLPASRERFHCLVRAAIPVLILDSCIPMRPDRDRALRNLYVLNLPLDVTTDDFEALFSRYGHVEHAVILATLDHLARHRPKLRMLDFPGIFHHPDVPETASVCQHALKKLSVQDVDIDEDMLARYATAVFPNAQLT